MADSEQNSGQPDGTAENQKRGLLQGNSAKRTISERKALRMKAAEWFYQSPEVREPSTRAELAKELGISTSTLKSITDRLPSTLAEYIREMQHSALAKYLPVLESIVTKAMGDGKDSVQAARMIQEMAESTLRSPKSGKPVQMPEDVLEVFKTAGVTKQREINRRKDAENKDRSQEITESSKIQ